LRLVVQEHAVSAGVMLRQEILGCR
jgi:hypothetical protein